MSAAHRDEIAKLESLYAENPEGRVFTHLAEAYRKAGDLDRAREILSDGIERHPDYSSAHVVLGRVLMDQGEGQQADAEFRRVLELDPHNLIAMRSRADIARERGDDEAAIELYNRLLDQEPGDAEVLEIVERLKGGGGAAAEDATAQEPVDAFTPEILDTDEEDAELRTEDGELRTEDGELRTETIAQVYARQGLYDRAAEVYRELSRARPQDESLRERLAEMEQLAEAQAERSDEPDAVSDFDAPSPSTEDAAWDEAPSSEPADQPVDQPAEEESPWSTSAPVEPEQEAPWEQTPQAAPEMDELEADELETDEPELGEMPAAGPYHDQWQKDAVEGVESEEGHPEVFHVEGLESTEVDASEAEVEQLAEIEVDEMDPETGLRAGATPDTAAPEEDLSEEMDVRDVPEPPAERPWERDADTEDEPSWLSGVGTPETEESVDREEAAAESVWSGAEWEGETGAETTPHAWTEEDDEEVDTSPPARDYFGGLLGWSGSEREPEDDTSDVPGPPDLPDASELPGESDLPGASGQQGVSDTGTTQPYESATSAERDEDDDDLDMFRSWLESLKQ